MGLQFLTGVGMQLDSETPAWHTQALDFHLNGACQASSCLLAQSAQLPGFFLIMTGKRSELLAQSFDGFVVRVECFDFIQQFLLHGCDFSRLDSMLASQGINSVQALFYFLQACWVGVEVIQETIEFAHGLFNLDLRAGQQGGRFAQ